MKILNYEFEGSTITYYFENGIEFRVEDWGNGTKYWSKNGKLHRLDGPAYEGLSGNKFWCIEGKEYSEQDFKQKVKELK